MTICDLLKNYWRFIYEKKKYYYEDINSTKKVLKQDKSDISGEEQDLNSSKRPINQGLDQEEYLNNDQNTQHMVIWDTSHGGGR